MFHYNNLLPNLENSKWVIICAYILNVHNF